MYTTDKEKDWTAKEYAESWKQQIGKTFEYRRRSYITDTDTVKSLTINGVEYEGGNYVIIYCTETYESGQTKETSLTDNYGPLLEGTLYNKLIHQMYCYVGYPYYFYIPLKQAKKKDGTLKMRTIFKPWGTHCTLY